MRHVLHLVLGAWVVLFACTAEEATRVDTPTQPEEDLAWEPDPDAETPAPPIVDPTNQWVKYCEDIDLPDNYKDGNPVYYLRGAELVDAGTEGAVAVYKKGRKLWYKGRAIPRSKKRKGDIMVRAHFKTDEQWRKDNNSEAIMVGNVMAGRGGNALVKAKLHEHRGNFGVRHKRRQDLEAARKAYNAHKYKPERIAKLQRYVDRYKDSGKNKDRVRQALAEIKRRSLYKDNPTFNDFRRWRAGLGYGFVLPYYVHIADPNGPPEMLCDPVVATYVLINKFRDIKRNLIARGVTPHYLNLMNAYGTGGSVRERLCYVDDNGRRRCPDAAKIKRLKKIGVDPYEVPDLGLAGNYRFDGEKEGLNPDERPYARRESSCTKHKSGKPRADHVWEKGACWYDHKPKSQYLEDLREYVDEEMAKIVDKREARAAKRLARKKRKRQAGA